MASIIDPALAKSLIQEFKTQNAAADGPALKTKENVHLHGYFIDRQSLEAILSNPKFVGISVHLAKHPECIGHKENKFTIIFAGAEPNPKFNTESNAKGDTTANVGVTRYLNTGDMYEFTQQCPPNCSGGGSSTGGN